MLWGDAVADTVTAPVESDWMIFAPSPTELVTAGLTVTYEFETPTAATPPLTPVVRASASGFSVAMTSRLVATFTSAFLPIAADTVGVTSAVDLLTPTLTMPPATASAIATARSDPLARTLTLAAPAFVESTTPAVECASTRPSRRALFVPFAVALATLAPTPTSPPAAPVAVAVCWLFVCDRSDTFLAAPSEAALSTRASSFGDDSVVASVPLPATNAPLPA